MRALLLCILLVSACSREPLVDSTHCGAVDDGFDEDVQGDAVELEFPVRVVHTWGSRAPSHEPFTATVRASAAAGGRGYHRTFELVDPCLSGSLVGQEADVEITVPFGGEELVLSTGREDVSLAVGVVERFQDGSPGVGVHLTVQWELDEVPQVLVEAIPEPEPPWELDFVAAHLWMKTDLPGEPLDGILGIGVQRRADELGQQSDYLMSSTLEPVGE